MPITHVTPSAPITPADYGMDHIGDVITVFHGAKVYAGANQSVNDAVVLFDTEDYDTDGYHSTGSNTSRMTIPSGLDGKYLVTAVIQDNTNPCTIIIIVNGVGVNGSGGNYQQAQTFPNNVAQVLDLVAGDYVELYLVTGGSHTIIGVSGGATWQAASFSISLLGIEGTGGGGYFPPPVVVGHTAAYEGSSTTAVVTTNAFTVGSTIVATVMSKGRGANSITQSNVTWTQRYASNSGGQYIEVWTGVVAGSPAGTTATFNFTGADVNYVEVFEVTGPLPFTSATLRGSVSNGSAALVPYGGSSITLGSYFIVINSANGVGSSYSGFTHPMTPLSTFGGVGCSHIGRANVSIVSGWTVLSSSAAYQGGVIELG